MRKERNHYTAEEKVAILRRHLVDKAPVSDVGGFGVSRFTAQLSGNSGVESGVLGIALNGR